MEFDYVQHVVHDPDDLVKILRKIPDRVHIEGFPNGNYGGYPLCWFSPLPPLWTANDKPDYLSDSLDRHTSRYGCFRFTIPFRVILQQFPTSFVLGTRVYNQENCHSILLTNSRVSRLFICGKHEPVDLTKTGFLEKTSISNASFKWLCYNNDKKRWDQLEFAVATQSLTLDPALHGARLDFVGHESSKVCVLERRNNRYCDFRWNKCKAMKKFLGKLQENNIELNSMRNLFEENVWNDLLVVQSRSLSH
ncbi:unnamed protein product [Adineta ricciae]|uniref:Uncharacterized protein n=1 Tax=Adineta ricciae TaxID=249248 RepID=A0A816H2K1_ADIRI|nr:unnamed protein product [Adineta ricciae]